MSVYWQMIIACRDRLNFLLLIVSWPCNITKWRKKPRTKIRKWFYYAIISFPSSLESYERSFLIEFIVKLLINSLSWNLISFPLWLSKSISYINSIIKYWRSKKEHELFDVILKCKIWRKWLLSKRRKKEIPSHLLLSLSKVSWD